MIDLFTKVHVPALALYFAVKVVLVAVSPVRTKDALACWALSLANSKALVSTATEVLPPVRPNDMKHVAVVTLALRPAVTVTRTLPVAGTVSVTAGPTVARST